MMDITPEEATRIRSFAPRQVADTELYHYATQDSDLLKVIEVSFVSGKWRQYIRAHHGEYLPVALFEVMERHKAVGEAYWHLISDTWMRSHATGLYTETFYDLLTRNVPPGKDALMKPDELAFLRKQPNLITVYRGTRPEHLMGLSWTYSRKVAVAFAKQVKGSVYKCIVPKAKVFAYLSRRNEVNENEQEMLLDFKALDRSRILRVS